MSEREHPFRGPEVEHRRDPSSRLLARDERGIAGDREVHVRVDQRGNQDQSACIDGARARRSRVRLRGDRRAVDGERPFPRRRVRELAAGDPEHPQSLAAAARSAALRLCFWRSEEHTSELQSQSNLVCRLLLEKKKKKTIKSKTQKTHKV